MPASTRGFADERIRRYADTINFACLIRVAKTTPDPKSRKEFLQRLAESKRRVAVTAYRRGNAFSPTRRYADSTLPLPLQKLINGFGEPVADPLNMRYFGWRCLTDPVEGTEMF